MNPPKGTEPPDPSPIRLARWIGIAVQAVILGTLLFIALSCVVTNAQGDRIFRYEGF